MTAYPARPGAIRSFFVGETVVLHSRVSVAGTRTPTDPTDVSLTSLKADGDETLVSSVPFVRDREGEFSLVLETVDLDPGDYEVVVTHTSGPTKVALANDRFILSPA